MAIQNQRQEMVLLNHLLTQVLHITQFVIIGLGYMIILEEHLVGIQETLELLEMYQQY